MNSRIFKPPGNKHHQPQIMLDQLLFGALLTLFQRFQDRLLLRPFQRRRQHIAAADVINILLPNDP